MEIKRIAARRSDGDWKHLVSSDSPNLAVLAAINSTNSKFKWDIEKNAILIEVQDAPDPSDPKSEYNYVVTLDLNDIAELLNQVSKDGLAMSPNALGQALKPLAVNLLRLVVAANGMNTSPLANEYSR